MTDFEWLVLAGGSGSRSENPALPKILQDVGGTRILDLLIDSLVKPGTKPRVTFVLRHGISEVRAHLENASPELDWSVHEDSGTGPVAAMASAASDIESSTVGCILGDTALRAPLDWFLQQHLASGSAASVVVRQSDHLNDSDCFELDHQGKTIGFYDKHHRPAALRGQLWGSSGILFADKELAQNLVITGTDVASALVQAMGADQVNCIRSSFYHRDSGTPERIASIRRDFAPAWRGDLEDLFNSRRALFLDRDGTIVPDISSGRTSLELSEVNPRVAHTIALAKSNGVPVFLATNQPALAKGFISFGDIYRVHNKLQDLLVCLEGVVIDDFSFCPHHPDAGYVGEVSEYKIFCDCRKPKSGMFKDLARIHRLDLENSILIGDSSDDEGAAKLLGMKFLDVSEYDDDEVSSLWGTR